MKRTGLWMLPAVGVSLISFAAAAEQYVTIGTGGQSGVYYVLGQSICNLVNQQSDQTGINCVAPSAGGSIVNIKAVQAGDLTMGVSQSDWQYHAYNGTSEFADNAFSDLRAVFSIHAEPYTVVARKDANVLDFADSKGKRINIGSVGSGSRGTTEVLLNALGWGLSDFALTTELKPAEQSAALSDNKLDVIVYTLGHPNNLVQEATSIVEANLVSVTGPSVEKLISENPYYAKAIIPGGMYAGNPGDTHSFGVRATLITSADASDEVVYTVVKAVFENLDRFKTLHPAFSNIRESEMIVDGLSAPLHPGALAYYRERGWVE